MKSIKILLISILITFTLGANLKRSKFWKSDEGSGSWESGYECPRINIALGNNPYTNQGTAKIYAKNIVNPTSEADKLGLVFEFKTAPGQNIKSVATNVGTNKFYIPYRYFAGDIKYTNPTGANKYIEGWFTDDTKHSYRIRIEFPYKTWGWFIDDGESVKIAQAINNNSVAQKGIIRTTKTEINNDAGVYLQKKPLLEASNRDAGALEEALKGQEGELKGLEKQIETMRSQISLDKKSINDAKSTLKDKENALATAEEKLASVSKRYTNIQNSIETIKKNKQPLQKTVSELRNLTETTSAKLSNNFNVLRKTAPIRKEEVDGSEKAYKDLNSKVLQDNLNKIFP